MSEDRIYMKHTVSVNDNEICIISNKKIEAEIYGFFLNNDYSKPVSPDIALERGFTMTIGAYKQLQNELCQREEFLYYLRNHEEFEKNKKYLKNIEKLRKNWHEKTDEEKKKFWDAL